MSSEKLLHHMVLFRFKEQAGAEQIAEGGNAFLALQEMISVEYMEYIHLARQNGQ